MALNLVKTAPLNDLARAKILLWGRPKFGKTTLAAQFPGAYFIATERGHDSVSVHATDCGTWAEIKATLNDLSAGNHPFRTVVVDTIDNAWRFCEQDLRERFGLDYEGDAEFGKGFKMISNEFFRVLTNMTRLGYGIVLISHAGEEEITVGKAKAAQTYRRYWPTLPTKPLAIALGLADLCLFMDEQYQENPDTGKMTAGRVLRTKPARGWAAGDRTGILPETVALGTSPAQAWRALTSAWIAGGGTIGGMTDVAAADAGTTDAQPAPAATEAAPVAIPSAADPAPVAPPDPPPAKNGRAIGRAGAASAAR